MRLAGLDIFRGYAILLMVIFHLSFDLNNFHYININILYSQEWKYFRYFIVTIFVFSSGISLKLANQNGINFSKVKRRVLVLGVASLLVTIGSYTQFPTTWIYFGILHFFLFSSLVGLLFLNLPRLSLVLAIVIIVGYNFSFLNMHWIYNILQSPLHLPIAYTQDLVNIIPWLGVFLLGVVFAHYKLYRIVFDNKFFNAKNRVNIFFTLLGKNSLVIYLVHQPLLFGLFFLLKFF
jgi:uncharacterized membrane protein